MTGPDPAEQEDADAVRRAHRRLPHWHLAGATYFVTFVTRDRRHLSPSERDIVLQACRHWDGERLTLCAAVVMPDHVHLILQPFPSFSLSDLLRGIKGYAARRIGERRPSAARIWLPEGMDRIMRDEAELFATVEYLALNPVRAGLAEEPGNYRWLYMAYELE